MEAGAKNVFAVMTHGVFSGPALERLMSSQIEAIVVSNTIPQHEKIAVCPKIQVCCKTSAVFYFFIISFTVHRYRCAPAAGYSCAQVFLNC